MTNQEGEERRCSDRESGDSIRPIRPRCDHLDPAVPSSASAESEVRLGSATKRFQATQGLVPAPSIPKREAIAWALMIGSISWVAVPT